MTTLTPAQILDLIIDEQADKDFPFVDATTSFSTKEAASDFVALVLLDPRVPTDLTAKVHRCSDFSRSSWREGYVQPDFFQVVMRSEAAGIAKASADIDTEYPIFSRLAKKAS